MGRSVRATGGMAVGVVRGGGAGMPSKRISCEQAGESREGGGGRCGDRGWGRGGGAHGKARRRAREPAGVCVRVCVCACVCVRAHWCAQRILPQPGEEVDAHGPLAHQPVVPLAPVCTRRRIPGGPAEQRGNKKPKRVGGGKGGRG